MNGHAKIEFMMGINTMAISSLINKLKIINPSSSFMYHIRTGNLTQCSNYIKSNGKLESKHMTFAVKWGQYYVVALFIKYTMLNPTIDDIKLAIKNGFDDIVELLLVTLGLTHKIINDDKLFKMSLKYKIQLTEYDVMSIMRIRIDAERVLDEQKFGVTNKIFEHALYNKCHRFVTKLVKNKQIKLTTAHLDIAVAQGYISFSNLRKLFKENGLESEWINKHELNLKLLP